ncbi:sigma-70 family RNA polymerase sigma factor [Pseudoalteromonas sp. Of7M-16]|uniref:sigma-70 family RNA polymerase sigma factor n=1 Tax=Pseudoalteromonas sp. Of7M-16 TaxID=2917756 RepID=UPI001EF683AD|nr:sigma-70 family RNA polymerase sigma factor [Pseudoalteromonas sp. Of7M-16]MCG7551682.1 sigma-70 family RNA polymerase sigma factor [Pseudoalteromonas sp. Of7M-16]
MLLAIKNWFIQDKTEAHDPLHEFKRSGENRYIEQAIDNFNPDLYHYLCTQSDPETAEDICQKTWLSIVEKRQYYQSNNTPKAYIFRIARNALVDEFRRQNKFMCDDNKTELSSEVEDSNFNAACCEQLYRAIKRLPIAQKEAICLQLEGFSLNQIAEITTANPETVKTRLRYAKQQLKETLGEPK